MPSVGIYRPPAARKLEQEQINSESATNSLQRRCHIQELDKRKLPANPGISTFKNAISSITPINQKFNDIKTDENKTKTPLAGRQRRPDLQVYVPRGRRLVEEKKVTGVEKEKTEIPQCKEAQSKSQDMEKMQDFYDQSSFIISQNDVSAIDVKKDSLKSPQAIEEWLKPSEKESSHLFEVDSVCSNSTEDSGSSSRRNSLESVEPKHETQVVIKNIKEDRKYEPLLPVKNKELTGSSEEVDWETMYDENGDCLNPVLMDQIANAVGAVTIEKPKSDYNSFKCKSVDNIGDEFSHVIEFYNFPPEFKTQDLFTVFSQFKNGGFEIKWVDDTHALGIFSSSAVATEVLGVFHPFVKTRPLKDATQLSKAKAKRSAEFLLPYRPRPDTCTALARRLVSGALGVKLPNSREEREAERKLLREAREKKKLAAKQMEEAWEGTFSSVNS